MAIGVFVVSHLFSENKGFEITFGNWAVIVILIITSIIVGYYTGSLGQKVRMEYPEIFESSRPNTVLGIKWYHWFWLFTIIHWIVLLGTFSVYQGLFLFFGTTRYAFLNEVTPALAILLVGCALCLLGLSTFKIFSLLLFSDRKGLTKGQVSLRILGWIAVVIVIVGSFQALTGYFMMP